MDKCDLLDKTIQQKLEKYHDLNSIIIVQGLEGSKAKLFFFKKEENVFVKKFSFDALIGRDGMGKQFEGDMKTPVGDFSITLLFGIKPDPGVKTDYLQVTENHYVCCDDCKFYNQIIDAKVENHQCKGEHLITYAPHYNYSMAIDYNKENIYGKGTGIFIHCNGYKPYTWGCIAIPENDMLTLIKEVDKDTKVCIF